MTYSCATASIVYLLGLCGIPWREALYELPAAMGNQLLASHWISQGVEIEHPLAAGKERASMLEKFEKLATRKHDWGLD